MTALARRYGGSLYELAAEEGLSDRVLDELSAAAECIGKEPDYLRLLSTPAVPRKDRCALLEQAFEGAHSYVVNFLSLLCENGHMAELSGCARAYRERYYADHNIAEAHAVSSEALTDAQRARLIEKLQKMTGKTVVLIESVDPAVLGGLRVSIGDQRLDGTVRRRLALLREELTQNS